VVRERVDVIAAVVGMVRERAAWSPSAPAWFALVPGAVRVLAA
jgi:hypothetical protein